MTTCIGPECDNEPKALGLCTGHYQQKRRGQYPLSPLIRRNRTDIRDDQGRKLCARCGMWKHVELFWRRKPKPESGYTTRDGLDPTCNSCKRDDMLRKNYNINSADYDNLLSKQGGVCAICHRYPDQCGVLHVDHDHACCPGKKDSCGGCVRGLLCSDCNGAIGMLQESPIIFANALQYLGGEPNAPRT